MTDAFGFNFSEPNKLLIRKLIEQFNAQIDKQNGRIFTPETLKTNFNHILEGNWNRLKIDHKYVNLIFVNIKLRNHKGHLYMDIVFDDFMTILHESLGISNDFITTDFGTTNAKEDFELSCQLQVSTEEMIFLVSGNIHRTMMDMNGKVTFDAGAQQNHWECQECSTSAFVTPSESSIQELADTMQETYLKSIGGARRRQMRTTNERVTTDRPRRIRSPVRQSIFKQSTSTPVYDKTRPPPPFMRRISPSHSYDSISSSTTEHDKEKEKRKTKKKKDNETTNQENEDTYTITFKKSPETAQEKIIKSIIERITEMRKTTDGTKTLTEDQFQALNKSIFEPMEKMHEKLREQEEKQTQTSEESSSDLEAQLKERLDQIRQPQTESQIITRSKSKEDVTKRNKEKSKDKDNDNEKDKSSDDNPDNWS